MDGKGLRDRGTCRMMDIDTRGVTLMTGKSNHQAFCESRGIIRMATARTDYAGCRPSRVRAPDDRGLHLKRRWLCLSGT